MTEQIERNNLFPSGVVVALLAIAIASRVLVFSSLEFFDYINRKGDYASFQDQVNDYYGKWDSGWYWRIAKDGYDVDAGFPESAESRYAFFPVVPLTVRGISALTGLKLNVAGSLLSHLAFVGSLFLFYRYCRLSKASSEASLWACSLLAFCPHGFIFSAFYTESVFLLVSLVVVNLLLSNRFVVGGLAGGLLTGVRANGLFIGVYFLWDWIRSLIESKRSGLTFWQSLQHSHVILLGGALVPVGLFAYWWFCFVDTGDAFAQMNSLSEGWGRHSISPLANVEQLWESAHYGIRFQVKWTLFMCLGTSILLYKKMYKDFAFCGLNLLLFLSGSLPQSLLRYTIVLFPIYLAFALLGEKRPIYLALLLTVFAITNTLLIYAWYSGDFLGV